MLQGEGARVGLGRGYINHNQEVAKWVRSWFVPVEEIDNVVDAGLAFYNESVMSSSSSSWASIFPCI